MLQTRISLLPISWWCLPLPELPVAGERSQAAFLVAQKPWSLVSNSVFGVHGGKKKNKESDDVSSYTKIQAPRYLLHCCLPFGKANIR